MEFKIGVAISLALVVLVGLVLYFTLQPVGIGSPTQRTTAPGVLERITVPGLKHRVHQLATAAGGSGAGRIYTRLFKQIHSQGAVRSLQHAISGNPNPQDKRQWLAWLGQLEAAAQKRLGRKALRFHAKLGLPEYVAHRAAALHVMADLASQCGASYTADNHLKRAKAAFNSLLLLGYRLYSRGIYVRVQSIGLTAMDEAATGLTEVYGKKGARNFALQRVANHLRRRLASAGLRWLRLEKAVHLLNPVPGDLANVAAHAGNRSWRIEGLEYLGAAQWRVTSSGERTAIQKFIRGYENNPDRFVAAAARQALGIKAGQISAL